MSDIDHDLATRETIARIGRELADAEHLRVQTLDVPKNAFTRGLVAGASIFAAGAGFVAALVGAAKAMGFLA
jgi:hypothetical protein